MSAWAEWTNVFTQDYETSSTINDGWDNPNSRRNSEQIVRSGETHYAKYNGGTTNGATLTYTGLTNSAIVGTSYGSSTQYRIEFDMAIIPANASSSSGAQTPVFTLFDSSNNSLCHWQVTTAAKAAAANSTGSFFLGSAASETAAFTANLTPYWYHITIEATDGSSTTMKVKDISEDTEVTYTLSESFIRIGKFTYATGKTQGGICLDDLTVNLYSDTELVTDPTINDPVYAGANRIVTITSGVSSNGSNTVTTYYTTDGNDPTSSSTPYTGEIAITEDCTLKAISISSGGGQSGVVSKDITVGKLTLNAPTIQLSAMTASGSFYNPTYSFTADQSDILGTPAATITYSFAGGSATEGTSYTASTTGTLTVTASADGYISAQSNITVNKVGYVLTNSVDVADLHPGATNNSSGYDATPLDYELIANTSFSGNHTTTGCVYHVANACYTARNADFTITCSDLTEDMLVVCQDRTKGTTYSATKTNNVITIPKWGTMKYYYLYTQPATTQSIAVSDAGWKTLCSPYSLDFTDVDGLKAYIITGGTDGVLKKTQVNKVPAGTGLLLSGSATSYNVPIIGQSAATDDVSANKLVGVVADKVKDAMSVYVLMNDATNGLAFYQNTNVFTVGANTAYLPANFAGSGAPAFFLLFDDNMQTTAIEKVEAAKAINGTVYNLNGQRVANPTKGLYIVNGKKIAIR